MTIAQQASDTEQIEIKPINSSSNDKKRREQLACSLLTDTPTVSTAPRVLERKPFLFKPESDILERVKAFLPTIAQANVDMNETLKLNPMALNMVHIQDGNNAQSINDDDNDDDGDDQSDVDNDGGDEDDEIGCGQHIEMDLGLGVFEAQGKKSKRRRRTQQVLERFAVNSNIPIVDLPRSNEMLDSEEEDDDSDDDSDSNGSADTTSDDDDSGSDMSIESDDDDDDDNDASDETARRRRRRNLLILPSQLDAGKPRPKISIVSESRTIVFASSSDEESDDNIS